MCLCSTHPYIEGGGLFSFHQGRSSDFAPLRSAFSDIVQWLLLRRYTGAHSCGTVGDSHSRSQLIAAKRTLTGIGSIRYMLQIRVQGRCKLSA